MVVIIVQLAYPSRHTLDAFILKDEFETLTIEKEIETRQAPCLEPACRYKQAVAAAELGIETHVLLDPRHIQCLAQVDSLSASFVFLCLDHDRTKSILELS